MDNYYEPFENAEEVWFWFCSSMIARSDGWRSPGDYGGKVRCCETNDIQKVIKRMKAMHQISNRHLRVMLKWGEMLCPPYYDKRAKKSEVRLWTEGMGVFDFYLRNKGII